ncbi:MAG: Asp-tRNA(Asn)/Glu-tRNA(Gln) amidotransferase subunit GatA [Halieaceae bacterium]|nr:Asp-tRNA(Asn)/Glu-tRNA(Gln) amidotransferase subunit GatA [Halieaceae bacterium]
MTASIRSLAADLRQGKTSAVELTQEYLQRIAQFDDQLNSYITLAPDRALTQAQAADERIANGDASLLCGIPIAHKDLFCTRNLATTCASKMLANFVPPYNATVVERIDASGAVTLGKTNLDEFAMGSSNENSFFGVVKNPWDLNCVPGGSSGGSAAAVAAELCVAATGTDTGGSIRQPAAFCGITGLKPTYGRVSRLGMVAYASSLDQGGVMAKSADDCAILLEAMAGFDPKDSTSSDHATTHYSEQLNESIAGLRIGIPRQYFNEQLDPKMTALLQTALVELEELGAQLIDIDLQQTALAIPAYYIIAPAEASTNLSRYDGVRYGYRCENPKDLQDLYVRSRSEAFGEEVQRRILVGTYSLSSGYYDAYYGQAQRARRLIAEDFAKAFSQVDIIASPTTPGPAFGLDSKTQDPVAMYLEDIYTLAVNLAGLPGLSMPAGFYDHRPVGLQLIGNHFDEATLLRTAHQFQQTTDWHIRRPSLISGGKA